MYGIYWRIIISIICFIRTIEANNKQHEKIFIAVDEFKFDIVNKDLVKEINSMVPSSNQLWVEFMLSKNITEFGIKLRFDVIKKDNRNMNLMKYDFDGCKALELAYLKITAIKVAMTELIRTSNIPKKCPVLANRRYYVHNYTINAKDYPEMIPAMHWQITMNFYIGKKYQGKMLMKGEVRK